MKNPKKAKKLKTNSKIILPKTLALEILYEIVFMMFYFLPSGLLPHFNLIISIPLIRNDVFVISLLLSQSLISCLTLQPSLVCAVLV